MRRLINPAVFLKLIIISAVLILLFHGCTKNDNIIPTPTDPELNRHDSIAKLLTKEMNPDSIKATIKWMEDMTTRFALADNRKTVAQKIKDRLIGLGLTDTYLDSFQLTITWNQVSYTTWQYNVVSHLHGSLYPDSVSVIGAHYDNIVNTEDPLVLSPGADDNASGVAAAIEIARVMKKLNFVPRGSINFVAFAAEEEGLHGSASYSSKALTSGQKITMMINNDMIGYEPFPKSSTWYVNIISYQNSGSLLLKARELGALYSGLSPVNDNTNYKRSDSYSFFVNGYKPIYFAGRETYPFYHTRSDISGNCNFEYCCEVAKISCALLVYKN